MIIIIIVIILLFLIGWSALASSQMSQVTILIFFIALFSYRFKQGPK